MKTAEIKKKNYDCYSWQWLLYKTWCTYPEDYSSNYAKESYVFNTPEDFINKWSELDEGIWYWVFVDDDCICSGLLDQDDIEIFENYFDITFDLN